MKKTSTIIFICLISSFTFSQNKSDINAFADEAVKMFTWDIQQVDNGAMMFLDVLYSRENIDLPEYLTLTVAKAKAQSRPAFISIIIPDNVNRSNGIFIMFGNKEPEKADAVQISFESCNNETCTARIKDGYVFDQNTNKNVDIFQKFLHFDQVYFFFSFLDLSNKIVSVPLFSFKEQYNNL